MRRISFLITRWGIPILTAALLGIFLAVASHVFNWSSANTFAVGGVFAVLLGLFGTPLLLLLGDQGGVDLRARDFSLDSRAVNVWGGSAELSVHRQALELADFLLRDAAAHEVRNPSFERFYAALYAQGFRQAGRNQLFPEATVDVGSVAGNADREMDAFNRSSKEESGYRAPAQGTSSRAPSMKISDFEPRMHASQIGRNSVGTATQYLQRQLA